MDADHINALERQVEALRAQLYEARILVRSEQHPDCIVLLRSALPWLYKAQTDPIAAERDDYKKLADKWAGIAANQAEAIDTLQAAVRELREVLSPFALFSAAVKGVPPEKDVVNYGRQGLRGNAFYEAADVFARTDVAMRKTNTSGSRTSPSTVKDH